jgi:ferredoxin
MAKSKAPDIDLSRCTACGGCIELCPDVFKLNPAGYMEVISLDEYPEDRIDEAIRNCPEDCISWTEDK